MNKLLTYSGSKLAEMIRTKEITSADVVSAHIDHIKKVNPVLNALVRDRFQQAMKEAREADRTIQKTSSENLPPFLGVPCTIKESFCLTGMPNSSGLVARKNIVSKTDATAVARVKKAGAIPLGVTNIPELCMWMETHNRVYGRTNNPYNPGHIVGGSSGGEGAIVGSGGSPFGVGADIGGSIRLPAFFNGVFGHKATGGTVPNTGQYPIAENEGLRYLTTGPIARKAEDLMPLLRLMAGPDGKDKGVQQRDLQDPAKVRIDRLTVLDVEGNGAIKVSEDLKAAQKRAAEYLSSKGAQVKKVTIKELKASLYIWSSMLHASNQPDFGVMLGNGKAVHPGYEFAKWVFRRSDHTIPSLILAMLEKIPGMMPARTKKFVELGRELRQKIVELLGENGVMLYPSYSHPAPVHRRPLLMPFNWVYTAILNMMELPVTQTPLGLNKQGLPLGVQVVSAHGNDHITIAVAMELEKAFGGWVPPKIGLLA